MGVRADVERIEAPSGSSPSPSVSPPSPPLETPWEKRILRKVVVLRPPH